MEKIITINDKEYRFVANAAMSYIYKQMFKKDLLKEFQKLGARKGDEIPEGLVDSINEVAFVMAKLGGQDKVKDIIEWLTQFSSEDFLQKIAPAVITLWAQDQSTSSVPKNAQGPQTEK